MAEARGAELLRVEQVAVALGVHRSTVFELLRHGELPVLRIGRAVRIPRKALEAWIEQLVSERQLRPSGDRKYIYGRTRREVADRMTVGDLLYQWGSIYQRSDGRWTGQVMLPLRTVLSQLQSGVLPPSDRVRPSTYRSYAVDGGGAVIRGHRAAASGAGGGSGPAHKAGAGAR